MPLRRVSVLGGSDPAARAEHLEAATQLGRLCAENGITVIYDGSSQGPIGALTAALNQAHGLALSVVPQELGERADGMIALPGGPERLEELLEACLSSSPGTEKPCGLLNTEDYFTGLLKAVPDEVVERFIHETQRGRLIVNRDPAELLRAIGDYRPPETRRQTS
ncbi:MAG TPA: LOG family protein [Gemmatimonadales bacterium]|nr:LOG family protein [Gemmatimonadales bacterium]